MPIILGTPVRKNSHILLSISIGYETQTKINFDEMIDAIIAEKNIKKVTLFKADWIQHYHIQIKENISEEIAVQKALEISNQWNIDNYHAIQKLKIAKRASNIEVKCWQDFITPGIYEIELKKLHDLKREDKKFSCLCDGMVGFIVNTFYKEFYIAATSEKKRLLKQNMLHFIYADCIFMRVILNNPVLNYEYELYRGHRNNVIKYLYSLENNKEKLKEVPLLYREKKLVEKPTISHTLNLIEKKLSSYQDDEMKVSYLCQKLIEELQFLTSEKMKTREIFTE